jgi:hypothetical protein
VHGVHQQRASTTHLSCATRAKRTLRVRSTTVCARALLCVLRAHIRDPRFSIAYTRIFAVGRAYTDTHLARSTCGTRALHARNCVRARCPVICARCMHTHALCALGAMRQACTTCMRYVYNLHITCALHALKRAQRAQTTCVDQISRACYTHTYVLSFVRSACTHMSCVRWAPCARRAQRACVTRMTRISRVRCTHSNVHSVHKQRA